jgi:branched-chain amino acid aminotransferase
MPLLAYVNGKFCLSRRAQISVFDRGLLYADGVYEAIRLWNGWLFRLDDHIERLSTSLDYLGIVQRRDPRRIVLDLARRSKMKSGYIRLIVTRGVGRPGIDPNTVRGGPTQIAFISRRDPLCLTVRSLSAATVNIRQLPISSLDPRKKTLNYGNKVLAKIEASARGADIPILLNQDGIVTEAGTENVFAVIDGKVVTSPVDAGLLPGITRDTVLRICADLGLESMEVPLTQRMLSNADEVFVTGTAVGVIRVRLVDGPGRKKAMGNVSARIRRYYLRLLEGSVPQHLAWLTPVP